MKYQIKSKVSSVFGERWNPEYPGKTNLPELSQVPTNSTPTSRWDWESSWGHIGGRQVRSTVNPARLDNSKLILRKLKNTIELAVCSTLSYELMMFEGSFFDDSWSDVHWQVS